MRKLLCFFISMSALFASLTGLQEYRPPVGTSSAISLTLNYLRLTVYGATNCSLSPGASVATIQAALTAAGGGTCTGTVNANTVLLNAGTYPNITSSLTLPCNATLTGPTIPYQQTHYQTAILQSTSSSPGQPLATATGCSSQRIAYLEWNGMQPVSANGGSGGGGFIYVTQGTTNLTIDHNWIHGMTACNSDSCGDQSSDANGIYMDGSLSTPITTNVTVTLNEFGSENYSDCAQAMLAQQTENGGGFCNGVGVHTTTQNVSVDHNIFHWLEQGAKYYSGQAGCNGFYMRYNTFYEIERIDWETQCNEGAHPPWVTYIYSDYNYMGNRFNGNGNGGQQNYDISAANGCTNAASLSTCVTTLNYNVDVQDVNNTDHGAGNEFWGAQGSTGNYNLFEGYVAGAGGAIQWSENGAFQFYSNTFNIFSGAGQSTSCDPGTGGYWNNEGSAPNSPDCSVGNTYSSVGTGTYPSALPTVTPSSGTFVGSQTVTLTNTGTNRDTNTTIWYTTDGSTPVPGSGTAQAYTAPFTVTTTTTVKAVGMWGAINQPYSYPSGYGYVPSSVVSATYTTSSGLYISPTGNDSNSGSMSSPWLTPDHALSCGQTITALAGTYSASNFTSGKWGTVTCPSANGVAWLTCTTFDACKISSTTGDAMWVDQDFWGVSGWETTTNSASSNEAACFRATPSGAYILHHVIFANDIANGCKGGGFIAYNTSTTASFDYINFVGDIAYNAAQGAGECFSGISFYEPIASDTDAGTHLYASSNFSYANVDPNPCAGGAPTDGEAVIFDTFDGRQGGTPVYTQQAVMQNNIGFFNGGRGFEVLNSSMGSSHAPIYVKGNTSFGNSTDNNQTGGCFDRGELYGQNVDSITWLYDVAQTRTGTSCSSAPLYGFIVLSGNSTSNIGNSWWAGTSGNNTDPNTAAAILGTGNSIGTNPAFSNPVNPGAPSCGSFSSTVACMAAVISDYTQTVTGPTVYGYQTPSSSSVTDPLFPAWLCSGSSLISGFPAGLVTPGCGGPYPVPAGGYLGNPGSVNTVAVGSPPIPFNAWLFYTVGSNNNALPDGFGNTVMNWSIVPGSTTCGTINSTGSFGNFTPTTPGTCNVKVTCSCTTAVTPSQWTMTVTSPVVGPAPPQVNVIMISKSEAAR